MDELHKAVEKAYAGGIALEAKPTLVGLLLDAALHLFESVAKTGKTRHKVASEVEAKSSKTRVVQYDRRVEVRDIVALELLSPVVPHIIIIRTFIDSC